MFFQFLRDFYIVHDHDLAICSFPLKRDFDSIHKTYFNLSFVIFVCLFVCFLLLIISRTLILYMNKICKKTYENLIFENGSRSFYHIVIILSYSYYIFLIFWKSFKNYLNITLKSYKWNKKINKWNNWDRNILK